MNSYKFAAAIYRVSGRVEYVDQAIRTYRGIVSHDAGEHIMHMAMRNGDVATVQIILDRLPVAALMFDQNGVRALVHVIKVVNSGEGAASASDILRHVVRSIVSTKTPRRCLAVALCIWLSTRLVNGNTIVSTAASAIITQVLKEYAREYVYPKYPSADERDLGIALQAYTNPDVACDITLHKIRRMITPDIRGEYSVSPLSLNFEKDSEHWMSRETSRIADAVLEDDPVRHDEPPCEVYGTSEEMRAWNCVYARKWGELADILESNRFVPRKHRDIWIISTICHECKTSDADRILRAALRRWPRLNPNELYGWMFCRNVDEIGLLMTIAPYQPRITDIFEKVEYQICFAICHEHWGFNYVRHQRLEALQKLYLMQR